MKYFNKSKPAGSVYDIKFRLKLLNTETVLRFHRFGRRSVLHPLSVRVTCIGEIFVHLSTCHLPTCYLNGCLTVKQAIFILLAEEMTNK